MMKTGDECTNFDEGKLPAGRKASIEGAASADGRESEVKYILCYNTMKTGVKQRSKNNRYHI